jgi:hypothetical protein
VDDVVNRHDVGVIQRRGGASLLQEAALPALVGHRLGGEHLERNGTLKQRVVRAIDHPHAAGAELANDLVVRQGPANHGIGADYMLSR